MDKFFIYKSKPCTADTKNSTLVTEPSTNISPLVFAEPSSVPAATASLKDKIGWITALSRNKGTQTGTVKTLRNDADAASIGTSTASDDTVTFTRGEWTS